MQDGQDQKNRKENQATKVTKIPKTKRIKYGMNKTIVAAELCTLAMRILQGFQSALSHVSKKFLKRKLTS